MLCPPLENCSLSGTECPYGFQQDKNGCLLCQCLNSKLASSLHVGPQGLTFQGAVNMIHFLWLAASCIKMLDTQRCVCLFASAVKESLVFDMFIFITAYLHPWLQSLQSFPSQECSCEQPHSNSCLLPLMDCCAHDRMTSPSTFSDDSCPELGKYCSLQCPMGYERDDFGCEVCECSIPMPKCRPLTCTKTCPYGYVWVHPVTHGSLTPHMELRSFVICLSACSKAASDITCTHLKQLYTLLINTHNTKDL